MPEQTQFDLIIIGAGPSGSAATLYAAQSGLKVLLLDKATFPRDKICGDALSGKSVDVLKELGLMDGVRKLPGAAINRIIFGSPDGSALNINLDDSELAHIPEGFVIRRTIFDHFMFEQAKNVATECHENFTVTDLIIEDDQVCGIIGTQGASGQGVTYRAPITFGADGYRSIVARKLGIYSHDPKHMVVALRQYYQGVGSLTDQIELHFIDEVNPGYFWLFPLEDGKANIGIGMLHKSIKKQNIDLKQALADAIASPRFRKRFSQAVPMEDPVGWNLPVGSKHYPSVGNGYMLLGDAAGLIDPFTGEGIGNALYSARYAVRAASEALTAGDYSRETLMSYDQRLWSEIGHELRISTQLQRLGKWPRMLNFVIKKAERNRDLANLIAGMIANEVPRNRLANPLFYLRLLFK